jgi:hypothetical protein
MEHEHLKYKTVKIFPKGHDRKPYAKPQLIEYGQIEKLTGGAGTHGNDGSGAKTKH